MPDFFIMYYLLYFGHYTGNIILQNLGKCLKKVYTNMVIEHKWYLSQRRMKIFFRGEMFGIKFQRHGHLHLYYFLT